MKHNRLISLLAICIIILSILASVIGIFSNTGDGAYEIESFRGETINIYGRGLYSDDSIGVVVQGKAQDIVTLVLGIPLLAISLYGALKGSLKARCTIQCLLYMLYLCQPASLGFHYQ